MDLSLQDLWGVVDGMDKMPDATTDPKGFAKCEIKGSQTASANHSGGP